MNLRRLTLFGVIFLAGYWLSIGAHPLVEPVYAGDDPVAPDVSLKKLVDGKTVNLSDYRGKWVLLNFWATWCPPCVAEMPSLEGFYKKFKGNNLTVLAVSVDKGGTAQVKNFVKTYGLTFEIFHDPASVAADPFGIMSLPSTYFIDPTGKIVAEARGGRDWTDKVITDYFSDLMSRQ